MIRSVCSALLLAAIFPVVSPLRGAAPDAVHAGDGRPLTDPTRPVREITRTSFTLQYFTREPTETRVQFREGDLPMVAYRGKAERVDFPLLPGARTVRGPAGSRTFHVIRISGLNPGRRYFYRVYDPSATPTREEASWGAAPPWRREWAVSTQAGKGRKTVIRLPVKVLLMPNVVNVASAHDAGGVIAPRPQKMTAAELARIKEEYAIASRFFFVNSGMRYWVDFHLFVDDRWQRWGSEAGPANANVFYKGWPVSRAYAGEDFRGPGGGEFTIVDTKDPLRVSKSPVVEERPFAAQIEQAFPRRWNPRTRSWEFYTSGGGTLGVDGFPQGLPGRSQYLGGGDTAWLAAHEFHHQMESQSAFSLANREDDRIVFDHPEPRRPEGSAWNTAGRHGEHWNVLAFWDRTLTDAQWLRIYFGETITVGDADEDGFPDDDPRLPLDEKRFGSGVKKAATDGRLNDLRKAMLSTWAPAPLQNTFNKPSFQSLLPNPTNPDTDGDGLPDDVDPYPLYPYPPFIWPLRVSVDGDTSEWRAIPPSGEKNEGGIRTLFQQGYDDIAYYGLVTVTGPWKRLRVTLDGEGQGVFSGVGVQGFEVTNGEMLTVRPQWAGAPGMVWKSSQKDGATVFEWSLPNRGEGLWFWERGGREIGAALEVTAQDNKVYSVYEPYDLFYARMLESAGRAPLPSDAPKELTREAATKALLPGDPALKFAGTGWMRDGSALRHTGEDESAVYVDGLSVREFDLWVRLEAKQDAIVGAFVPETKTMSAGNDYIAFVGGYANTVTRLRLFSREAGDDATTITPGPHTLQLSRRNGSIWCLWDGKPILHAPDPDPKKIVDRLAVLGGYNGDQIIHEIRIRVAP